MDEYCGYPEPSRFFILYWIGFSGSLLSLIGSLFIVISYFVLSKYTQGGHYRLILYLTLADIIIAIQQMIVKHPCDLDFHSSKCISQAFLSNFSILSSLIWTLIFSIVLYRDNKYYLLPGTLFRTKVELCYVFWGFGFPLIISLIILFVNEFGPLRYWCWIPIPGQLKQLYPSLQTSQNSTFEYIWIGFSLFLTWGIILSQLFIYCMVVRLFNNKSMKIKPSKGRISALSYRFGNRFSEDSEEISSKSELMVQKDSDNNTAPTPTYLGKPMKKPSASPLFVYPIILIVLWTIPSINRLWTLFNPSVDYFFIYILHILCLSMTGLANSIAYGLNRNVRQEIKECALECKKKCRRQRVIRRIDSSFDQEYTFQGNLHRQSEIMEFEQMSNSMRPKGRTLRHSVKKQRVNLNEPLFTTEQLDKL